MICNFFEFKFIQFKTNIIALKKASTVMLFLCIFCGTLFPNFFELYFPSSFFICSFDSQKNFLKNRTFFLRLPNSFHTFFEVPQNFFEIFSDALEQFSISFELFQNLSENFSGCFRFFNLLQTFRANFQKAFRFTLSKSKNI